jgi:CrcB protein
VDTRRGGPRRLRLPLDDLRHQRHRVAGAGDAALRHRPLLALALGPGLLGGYTTLSTYAEETRALLADGATATALTYLLGTLAACLVAVSLASRLYPVAAGDEFEAEGGDE